MKITLFLILFSWASFADSPYVIYGTDDRQDLHEISDPLILEQAHSTLTFTLRGLIMPRSDGDYNIANVRAGDSLKLCPEVRFADQPSIGACSSTLVSPRHVLTAGHCMPDQKRCDEIYLMFGFHSLRPGEYPQVAPAKDVYRCKKLLVRKQDDRQDFALIELDREVTDRRPVVLGYKETIKKNQKVRMIGYPDGMPSKVVSGASVRSATSLKFVSNLDAFKGNSGSAVFSETTGDMVGILFKGNPDYVYDNSRNCRKLNVCKNHQCRGEDATQISGIWHLISPYLQ